MTSRKKILINAYAISPTKGSEFSVGWNTINLLAHKYSVYVLYGTSGESMGDTAEIDNLSQNEFNENIKFIKVYPNCLARVLNNLNNLGFWLFFSPAFYFYQLDVLHVAKKLHKEVNFDIIHQLNPIGFREPGFLWQLDVPFIWGPVCGTYILPSKLIFWKDLKLALDLTFRNMVKKTYLKFSLRIKEAVKRADVIIVVTKEDSNNFLKYFKRDTYNLTENFVENNLIKTPITDKDDTLKLVWVGRIDRRKNLGLLLDVLSKLKEYNWHLDIIGDGQLRNKMKTKSLFLGLDYKINFRGYLPRNEVKEILQKSDLHVITSLYEATSTVLFEAYQNGIPTISLNHCGMADVICEKCGFLVSVEVENYEDLVGKFMIELKKIMTNRVILDFKSGSVATCLDKYSASQRLNDLETYYEEAIINFNQKNKVK